jgi:hypothetical protein
MAENELKRIDIGFEGGQILELRVTEAAYGALRSALQSGPGDGRGWHVVATQDSEVAVDLDEIVYVRVETERHRVGF